MSAFGSTMMCATIKHQNIRRRMHLRTLTGPFYWKVVFKFPLCAKILVLHLARFGKTILQHKKVEIHKLQGFSDITSLAFR